jgi:hypothetical protein
LVHIIYNKKNRIIFVIIWFLLITYFLINWGITDKSFETGVAILALFASNIISIILPTKKDSFNIDIIEHEFQRNKNKNIDIDITYPVIEYKENTPIENKLNKLIQRIYFKYDVDIKKKKILSDDLEYFSSFYDETFRSENILSIRFNNDAFSGGAHGEIQIITLNINLFNGEEFEFKDIFRSFAYREINKIVEKELEDHEWKEFFHDQPLMLRANQNFYINHENNLVVTFFKYELAPGNCGPIEVEISLDKFKEYINPNGPFHLLYNKYIDSSNISKGIDCPCYIG